MSREIKRIGVVGGGAAGMMAAAVICEDLKKGRLNAEVFLLEKNAYLGAKVLISGGGRCNVTTGEINLNRLLECYPRGNEFLKYSFKKFGPKEVIKYFEDHGLRLKVEEDNRVFPLSDSGAEVVRVFEKIISTAGMKILFDCNIGSIEKSENKFVLKTKECKIYEFDILALTCGGNAYRHTGSTGDGYAFATGLGHKITRLAPSLSSYVFANDTSEISGVTFADSILKFGKFIRKGAFVFTHKGLSGPAVFALSSMAAYIDFSKENPAVLTIDLMPNVSINDLEKNIIDLATRHSSKTLYNLLDMLLPKRMAVYLLNKLKIDKNLFAARLSKEMRKNIANEIKAMSFNVVGRGAGDEFVTAGGIDTNEVDEKTMQSKICPNLYFGGELLNVDGFTGGYNLQAAWATGYILAKSIIKNLK